MAGTGRDLRFSVTRHDHFHHPIDHGTTFRYINHQTLLTETVTPYCYHAPANTANIGNDQYKRMEEI